VPKLQAYTDVDVFISVLDLLLGLLTISSKCHLPERLLSVSSQGWAYLCWYLAEVTGSALEQDQTV